MVKKLFLSLLCVMLSVPQAVSAGASYYVTEEQMEELTLQSERQQERLNQLERLSESLSAQSERLRTELEESRRSLKKSKSSAFSTGLVVGVSVGLALGGIAVFAVLQDKIKLTEFIEEEKK